VPAVRRSLAVAAVLTAFLAAPAFAQGAVTIVDNAFQPSTVTIMEGESVTWTHQGNNVHTVTADDGSFDSGNLASGQQFSHTFDAAGTYAYHCEIHGGEGGAGMSGTVVVEAQPAPTTAPAPTGVPEVSAVPGSPLPHTGGGSVLPLGGAVLMAAAVVLAAALRRRAASA
jgi:plastocyanin